MNESASAGPLDSGPQRRSLALLAYGFRPFFLLAGLHAALAIPLWVAFLQGLTAPGAHLPALTWHAHEMIYGFAMAAVAGFLLTAVPSWTHRRGFAGVPLLVLVLVWLAGRVVVTLPLALPPGLAAAVDVSFPIALIIAIAPSLVRSKNRRNLVFVGLLALLFLANLHFHISGAASTQPLHLAVNSLLVLVTLVGGRVVPAFTSSRLRQLGHDIRIPRHPTIDGGATVVVVAILALDLIAPGGGAAGVLAAAGAAALTLRLARWQGHRTLGEPIVWVLHLGYAWLPVGLALKAEWLLGGLATPGAWVHALTTGAFATMILAVMTRAALGHTGRAIVAPPSMVAAYLLVTAAAVARVFGPLLPTAPWSGWIVTSALLWSAAFALFVIAFAPILTGPRADGKPG